MGEQRVWHLLDGMPKDGLGINPEKHNVIFGTVFYAFQFPSSDTKFQNLGHLSKAVAKVKVPAKQALFAVEGGYVLSRQPLLGGRGERKRTFLVLPFLKYSAAHWGCALCSGWVLRWVGLIHEAAGQAHDSRVSLLFGKVPASHFSGSHLQTAAIQ